MWYIDIITHVVVIYIHVEVVCVHFDYHPDVELGANLIGDVGMQALSSALAGGVMASLETLYVDDGPLGTEYPALKAACEARGIELP